jgi:hypothetical protein
MELKMPFVENEGIDCQRGLASNAGRAVLSRA